ESDGEESHGPTDQSPIWIRLLHEPNGKQKERKNKGNAGEDAYLRRVQGFGDGTRRPFTYEQVGDETKHGPAVVILGIDRPFEAQLGDRYEPDIGKNKRWRH